MKLIPLTQGKFAMVDDEDFVELSQHRWFAGYERGRWYVKRSYLFPDGRRTTRTMHSLLTGFKITDHIDGDGLNNQRHNLREVTKRMNGLNSVKRAGCSSEYKGVSRYGEGGRWQAHITDPSRRRPTQRAFRRKSLGLFWSEIEAAKAHDAAVRKLYGHYATYNFPLPGERSALTGEVTPS